MTAATRDLAGRAFRSDFVRQIASTFGTRLAVVAVGLVSSVLIARSLGPDGRGVVAIAAAVTAVATQFGNLGLHASNTWAVARDATLLSKLLANSLAVSAVLGAILIAVVVAVAWLIPGSVPLEPSILALALIAIPLALAMLLLQNLLLGVQRIREYNLLDIGGRVLGVAATFGLIVLGAMSPLTFLLTGTFVSLLIVVAAVGLVRRLAGKVARPSLDVLRAYWSFGLRAYAAALASYLVIRADLFLVEAYLGFGAAGQYSITVALADLVYSLPVVIGSLLFPRLARMQSDDERIRYTQLIATRVAALMAAGILIAAVGAPLGIELLYGQSFAPAAPAFIWLMPGIAFLSVNTVFMNFFAAVGLPRIALVAPFGGLVVNVALNMLLLPIAGIVGASVASTIAYGLMLLMSSALFVRRARTTPKATEQGHSDA